MYPTLFTVFGFPIASYGVAVAVGSLIAIHIAKREIVDRDRVFDEETFWNHIYFLLFTSFVGAKLLFILKFWGRIDILGDPVGLLRFGFVFYGGMLFCVLSFFVFYRIRSYPFWFVFDRALPLLALAHGIGRLGCFLAGCCHGTVCNLPWAVTFNNPEALVSPELLGIGLHPAQLYDAFGNFLLAGFLYFKALRWARSGVIQEGAVSMMYLIGYFVLRLAVEFVRGDDRGGFVFAGLTSYQWISLMGIGVAALLLWRADWRRALHPFRRLTSR